MKARRNSQVGEATRAHIMNVAELLFSESGPAAVSVRDIAASADVNLAAINYHFGSKENLFKEVFERCIRPLNEERMAMLAQAISARLVGRALLREVLRAFNAPIYRLASSSHEKARLLVVARYLNDAFATPEGGRAVISEFYEPVRRAFVTALSEALPELPREEVVWRYNSMVGMSLYALGGIERMAASPYPTDREQAAARGSRVEQPLEWSITFLEAAFCAPSTAR